MSQEEEIERPKRASKPPPLYICVKAFKAILTDLTKQKKWQEIDEARREFLPDETLKGLGWVKIHRWGDNNPAVYSFKPLPRGHALTAEEVRAHIQLKNEHEAAHQAVLDGLRQKALLQQAAFDLVQSGYQRRKRQLEEIEEQEAAKAKKRRTVSEASSVTTSEPDYNSLPPEKREEARRLKAQLDALLSNPQPVAQPATPIIHAYTASTSAASSSSQSAARAQPINRLPARPVKARSSSSLASTSRPKPVSPDPEPMVVSDSSLETVQSRKKRVAHTKKSTSATDPSLSLVPIVKKLNLDTVSTGKGRIESLLSARKRSARLRINPPSGELVEAVKNKSVESASAIQEEVLRREEESRAVTPEIREDSDGENRILQSP